MKYYKLGPDKEILSATREEGFEYYSYVKFNEKLVERTYLGKVWVSTVFLVTDYAWGEGPPVLFETMVFSLNSFNKIKCERYCTYKEALEGHKNIVEKYRKEEDGTLLNNSEEDESNAKD